MPTLATFNANNFFLRYRFTDRYSGATATSPSILSEAERAQLIGFLPGLAFGNYASTQYIVWDQGRRTLAAQALAEPDGVLPDILCLQEVENIHAIRVFNDDYLGGHYPYSLLIDAYDPRLIDVGLLSRFPITGARSHIDDVDAGQRIFSRDCLEAQIELPDGETLHLLLNHLKSKYVRRRAGDTDAEYDARVLVSHNKRLRQAQAIADYIDERFEDRQTSALYAVVGDFNDTPLSPWLAPLMNTPRLTDVLARHRPLDDRWTYYWRSEGRVSQIDYVLVSRALRARVDARVAADAAHTPHIERQGLGYREVSDATGLILPSRVRLRHFEDDGVTPVPANVPPEVRLDFRFARYPAVMADWHDNISDHCPVKVWF